LDVGFQPLNDGGSYRPLARAMVTETETQPPLTIESLASGTYRLAVGTYNFDSIDLMDGAWVYRPDPRIGPTTVKLTPPVAFGDLDGDGIDDAALTLVLDSGGTGHFYY